MAQDLKDTLNLPQTNFPMRGNMVEREPARIDHWKKLGLYEQIQAKNAAGPSFILHDGPPFTNGDLHLGHALNKTLKDTILRFKWMQGYNAPYIPGWDSHGLPIEHKVSRELQDAGRTDYTPLEVREACAKFANKYREIQTEQFQRLGVLADWDNEYWTIHPEYEAAELETFAKFVEQGLVYRSKKPVYWSIPCATALAEAEIEYRDHKSISVFVKLPLSEAARSKLALEDEASVLIWTTTPWTLPANLAVSVHPKIEYSAVKSNQGTLIVATALLDTVVSECSLEGVETISTYLGAQLEGLEARHPFIDRASPILLADYVTTESGTGCVHTAPGHGLDDYITGINNGLEVYCPLDDAGCYVDDGQVPADLVGLSVLDDGGKPSPATLGVLKIIAQNGSLIGKRKIEHSYPHCWRSKTPVVFRAMDQWFIALDKNGDRQLALKAIEDVNFIPSWGKNRIRAAVENRPDWCISRQRTWGVPIPAFYDEDGGAYIDADVIREISKKVAVDGTNLWFKQTASEILDGISLPEGWPTPDKLKCGSDTLDVWIDSGSSHRAVLQKRPNLSWPADLYLEGSDQHRGWFQSSLWTSVIADKAAPYKNLLTHGFIVKEDGTKLSKSDGAARPLPEWIKLYGADIVRLWICSQDYRNDVPVSDKIVKNVANNYRNWRNTLRYQVGSLHDFNPATDAVPLDQLHPVDMWALNELAQLVRNVTEAYEAYEFHRAFKEFIDPFVANTLSSTYHDILKDRLYTAAPNDPLRRSSQTAIAIIFSVFTRLVAPLIPHTADEAWSFATNDTDFCDKPITLEDWPYVDEAWDNPEIAADIRALRKFLSEHLNDRLEELRQKKTIGQSLDAKAVITGTPNDQTFALLQKYESDLPELFILSQVTLQQSAEATEMNIEVAHADGVRCPRSWRWVEALVETEEWGPVSPRCAEALKQIQQTTI
ncbi:MAG: isoleucine--tRNA ligase [Opitutales bacterium]|jgi:isoleucyl-tRNA synthetase|nr:isoleucine--tRNA ligase [Opitutales bacterium]MDP4643108.1 isoleucine--tRNA ligase [Opitutales bacterium]MDP4776345.1 isoleucine--tRNA ligase [Opitutales bacterium]MDP4884682.1 isoleucine--tRNA ligase [Opitutales bacterium]MDP5080683.1 isoleucine--tRNA ligase [Opitutales bacterium]